MALPQCISGEQLPALEIGRLNDRKPRPRAVDERERPGVCVGSGIRGPSGQQMTPPTPYWAGRVKPSASPAALPWLSMRQTGSPSVRALFSSICARCVKEELVRSGSAKPIVRVRPARTAWAARCGRWTSAVAARGALRRTAMPKLGLPFRESETVATDTPTLAATSFMVAIRRPSSAYSRPLLHWVGWEYTRLRRQEKRLTQPAPPQAASGVKARAF